MRKRGTPRHGEGCKVRVILRINPASTIPSSPSEKDSQSLQHPGGVTIVVDRESWTQRETNLSKYNPRDTQRGCVTGMGSGEIVEKLATETKTVSSLHVDYQYRFLFPRKHTPKKHDPLL